MKFVLWQNVLSIHQSAFVKALASKHDVTLVVAEQLTGDRVADGWKVPDMGNARVVVAPDGDELERLANQPDSVQVFSGIDAYPMVYAAFRKAVAGVNRIAVMMEPYDWLGLKGVLRRFKYCMLWRRYGNRIDYVFATGDTGLRAFRKAGFSENKLRQWGYFTENSHYEPEARRILPDKPSLLFVGRLDWCKNIMGVLERYGSIEPLIKQFTIVGDGELRGEVEAKAKQYGNVVVTGALPNDEIPKLMSSHDLFILPSLYDGWGAVVNEALTAGTPVLCSDACGAGVMLDGEQRGDTFDRQTMVPKLRRWLERGPLTDSERAAIRKWAADNISGTRAAEYFARQFTHPQDAPTRMW